jgi:hypothetical protein
MCSLAVFGRFVPLARTHISNAELDERIDLDRVLGWSAATENWLWHKFRDRAARPVRANEIWLVGSAFRTRSLIKAC